MLDNRLQSTEECVSEAERQLLGTAKESNVKAELKKVHDGLTGAR
jgi:hypothetical protein